MDYGTVISALELPSTRKFRFVINPGTIVRRGQFVQINVPEGKLVGRVSDVFTTNRYFMQPESVTAYEKGGRPLEDTFPVGEWEYLVAEARALGVCNAEGIHDSTFPPSPGMKVVEPEKNVLIDFIGIDENGVHIGELPHHNLSVKLNVTKMLQKHLAILAVSGAGKSYLTSVLFEELLSRKPEEGPAIIIADPHGEYSSFADDPQFAGRVRVFPSDDVKIGLPHLSGGQLARFSSDLTAVQVRELDKVIRELRGKEKQYSLTDLEGAIEENENIKTQTKDALLSAILNLGETRLFGAEDYPHPLDLARQGGLSILDLSAEISMRKKRIIVAYLADKLFHLRRKGAVPPYLLVLEEAQQFVPEKESKEENIAKPIIITMAREGRKFHASLCLISQRPKHLSTTVLSQCNTNIILRVTNPYDLKHIEESSEGITSDVAGKISTLRVGTGLVVGESVNYPIFVKIRKRRSKESKKGQALEDACREFAARAAKKKADAKAFM